LRFASSSLVLSVLSLFLDLSLSLSLFLGRTERLRWEQSPRRRGCVWERCRRRFFPQPASLRRHGPEGRFTPPPRVTCFPAGASAHTADRSGRTSHPVRVELTPLGKALSSMAVEGGRVVNFLYQNTPTTPHPCCTFQTRIHMVLVFFCDL